ncbi:aminotransferase class V-fold PLP-dependent enzyme [bacterium]|nr:aminotransferase class V-fold PLP-dependent enzyme [bacterium]
MQPSHQPALTRSADSTPAQATQPHALHAFLNPQGDNMQQVRRLLRDVLDQTVDDLAAARQLPTVPQDWTRIPTDRLLPAEPVSEQELVSACRDLLRGSMNPAHPRYLGHMDPLPSTSSIAASLITAAVNNNLLSREMSPIFSELEQRLLRALANLFGLPSTAGGMLQSGGSLCNLQALTVARNVHFDIHTRGLAGIEKPPVLFASERCHSSIQKAAMVLGLGTQAVVPVPTDERGKMRMDALEKCISETRSAGQAPFAVVATAGTTVTGNIDPLPETAEICRRENLWFHVDASYGGAMVFSDQLRPLLNGIELADSVTFNPQKWCYVTKACALVLFRDEQILDRAFRIAAPYMSLNEEHGHVNLGEWGIQGTRAPDIAKWWLTLLQLGQSGLAELVDHSCQLTELLLAEIRQREFLEIATPPEMNIVCFRDCRAHGGELERGAWNARLQSHLMKSADTFFSLPHYRESRWLKAVVLNPFTTQEDFSEIFAAVDRFNG